MTLEKGTTMRALRTMVVAVMLLLGSAAPALATHTHVRLTGNGSCVILAANGGENTVQLPFAGEFAENRRHPLHVNVHLGEPGTRRGETVVWVMGSDGNPCDHYVND
jgi:hypothetical protein